MNCSVLFMRWMCRQRSQGFCPFRRVVLYQSLNRCPSWSLWWWKCFKQRNCIFFVGNIYLSNLHIRLKFRSFSGNNYTLEFYEFPPMYVGHSPLGNELSALAQKLPRWYHEVYHKTRLPNGPGHWMIPKPWLTPSTSVLHPAQDLKNVMLFPIRP